MCWSFQVSAGFALVEAVSIGFLVLRAKRSNDPYIRGQLYALPLLLSILAVETIEALVWLDTTLIEVTATEGPTCSAYNQRLSLLLWLLVFPFQPCWVILPCRLVGHARNRDLLAMPQAMSLMFVFMHWWIYFEHVIPQWQLGDAYVPEQPPRWNLQQQGYRSYSNSETCTYIGQHGHLFWTLATPDTWATPNVAAYIIIWLSVMAAKPYRFASGLLLFAVGLCLVLSAHYGNSVETASVWCFTGVMCNAYFILQPYVLPCSDDGSSQDKCGTTLYEMLELGGDNYYRQEEQDEQPPKQPQPPAAIAKEEIQSLTSNPQ